MFKEDMNVQRVIEPGRVLCIGAKWLGSGKTMFVSEWEHGQKGMAEAVSEWLHEAEGVIHYNGNKFDLPKIRGFLLLNGCALDIYDACPLPGKRKFIQSVNEHREVIPRNYELMDLLTYCQEAIGHNNVQDIGRRLMKGE